MIFAAMFVNAFFSHKQLHQFSKIIIIKKDYRLSKFEEKLQTTYYYLIKIYVFAIAISILCAVPNVFLRVLQIINKYNRNILSTIN